MEKQRFSNFELLRIIAIFMIVIHHFAIWTPWDFESHSQLYRLLITFLMIGGKLGVNVFVMITGYFMIQSNIKIKSIIKLIVQVTVFSIVLYVVTVLFHIQGTTLKWTDLVNSMLPILFNRYWFITAYFQLYLLIPLINKGFNQLNQKAFSRFLVLFFIVFSVWPMLYFEAGTTSSHLSWFIFMYALGAYFKLFQNQFDKKAITYFIKMIISVIITMLCTWVLIIILSKPTNTGYYFVKEFMGWYTNIFVTRDYSPFILIISIFLFLTFMKLNIKNNRVINYIASMILGVYLFQSTPVISGWLWKEVFRGHLVNGGIRLFIYSLFVGLILTIIGVLLSMILNPLIKILTNSINFLIAKITMKEIN
ncbi:acyltransferase [Vagococcus sp. JNUCC 83]